MTMLRMKFGVLGRGERPLPLRIFLKLSRTLRDFRKAESGSVTIEFVLWVPILMGFVMLSTDATLLMHEQTYLSELSRDAARMVAIGDRTVDEARTETLGRLNSDTGYEVTVALDGEYVAATVSVPFNKVILFNGVFAGSAVLSGGVTMWIEGAE